jgi:hypothetical protein
MGVTTLLKIITSKKRVPPTLIRSVVPGISNSEKTKQEVM